jgi:catechol 2,3-dioxygenase-like lactoylglutathione lyase family enzyme
MRINLTSVMVSDQRKALAFYTEVLGFVKRKDIPVGEDSFLTVASPEGPDDVELLLEPNDNPAVPAKEFQRALYEAGIPAATFGVDDVQKEYERLTGMGVRFTGPPTTMPGVTMATFDDTCGNLIMIAKEETQPASTEA